MKRLLSVIMCAFILSNFLMILSAGNVNSIVIDPNWGDADTNLAVCNENYHQIHADVVSDGAGGAIFTWIDFRNNDNYDIYVQRVDNNGNALWKANGVVKIWRVSWKY